MGILESVIVAISLCADCFACTICSGVTMRDSSKRNVLIIALSFAIIQAGLLLIGWAFGNLFVGLVEKISHFIGFALLLYVGGSMLIEGIRAVTGRGDDDVRSLDGFKNVVLSGIATSIDALAVGISQSMVETTQSFVAILPLFVSVFVVTALSVIAGLLGGRVLGRKFGHWAEIAGGLVLIVIGCSFLF